MQNLQCYEAARARRLIGEKIAKYSLDLKGLTVFTEAATGPYAFTPMLCALANADKVYALAKDSRWGAAQEVVGAAKGLSAAWGVEGSISFVTEKRPETLARADIVMNCGNVRPIDRAMVSVLKPTCVVPLMWETWEYRPGELELEACREQGILVLGTDEERIDFRWYTGMVLVSMVLGSGLELYGNRMLVLSSDPVCRALCRVLEINGAEYRYTGVEALANVPDKGRFIPPEDKGALLDFLASADACICDDRRELGVLIGEGGILTAQEIKEANPGLVVLNRSGIMDADGLRREGVRLFPDKDNEPGYPNATSASLGMTPVIELTAAGLKVGEVMARARLAGLGVEGAAREAVQKSPAQDFPGRQAWIRS